MIKLTSELPRSIFIDGTDHAINTDFRIMAELESRISRTDISDKAAIAEIVDETVSALFINKPDAPAEKIIDGLLWYYRCGKAQENTAKFFAGTKRYYDYDEDSDLIFAAFSQQYGDDLISSDMHWWEFRAKFLGLTDETEFVKIMQYRCADISKIKSADERGRVRRIRENFSLRNCRTAGYRDLASRNNAMRSNLLSRFEEVKKRAEEGV